MIGAEALRQTAVHEAYNTMLVALVDRLEELLRKLLKYEGRSMRGARSLAAAIAAAIQGTYQIDAGAPGVAARGSSAPAVRRMVEGIVLTQPTLASKRKR